MSSALEQSYWLVKFAPFRTSWAEIVRRGIFTMRGVRSHTARANLAKMRKGDSVIYYHSQEDRAAVGMMEVAREAYPDPTSADLSWLTCDFFPVRTFTSPVTLETMRTEHALAGLPLLRQPRLAVMPLDCQQFWDIVALSQTALS